MTFMIIHSPDNETPHFVVNDKGRHAMTFFERPDAIDHAMMLMHNERRRIAYKYCHDDVTHEIETDNEYIFVVRVSDDNECVRFTVVDV